MKDVWTVLLGVIKIEIKTLRKFMSSIVFHIYLFMICLTEISRLIVLKFC